MKVGSRNGASLYEGTVSGGRGDRAPLLGTQKDKIRKAPDMGISLVRGTFMSEGNLESGGGLVYRGL